MVPGTTNEPMKASGKLWAQPVPLTERFKRSVQLHVEYTLIRSKDTALVDKDLNDVAPHDVLDLEELIYDAQLREDCIREVMADFGVY